MTIDVTEPLTAGSRALQDAHSQLSFAVEPRADRNTKGLIRDHIVSG